MIGTELGHYRLIAVLGEGSMGRVFAAEDTRLGRRVALKLLADALASVPAHVERFQREARLLAAVNHPNVVTVHSVEQIDGRAFFTMEYIEGQTLRERVRPGGLTFDELLAIALPLAAGLGAAHANGIVHRDLKPANVMLSRDGRLKIVDFGIAKPERNALASQAVLTDAGMVLGTPAYMAPEQLRGEPIDARVDLFAYAVLLYELATGTRPFAGASDVEIVTAILRDEPRPLLSLRHDLPRGLQAILDRCLHKDPAQRPASAAEVLEQLSGLNASGGKPEPVVASAKATPAVSALAVLPLQEIGAGVEDLLADGITEALIANLARASELRVISRSSSLRFKGSSEPLQDIARRLGVDALVCGSVRRAGNRIRISVELIDPASDRVLWAEHYDRELEDVLRLQDEISDAIAAGVQARIGAGARAATPQRVDPEVYFLDLKGRSQVELRTEASFRSALAHFRQALVRSPDYAPAYVGIARAYNMLASYGLVGASEAKPELEAALARARALRADPAEVLGEQAQMRWQLDFDWGSADADYRRGLELAPSNGRLWYWRGLVQATAGNFEAGQECLARAESLDPLSYYIPAARGWVMYFARRLPEAMTRLRDVIEHSPDLAPAYWLLGMVQVAAGDATAAIANFEAAIGRFGRASRLLGYLGHACARAGREAQARALLAELQQRASTGYVPEYFRALVHTGLGEREAALSALELAWARRDSMLRDLRVDASFDELREEPRFRAVLAALRLAGAPADAITGQVSTRVSVAPTN